MIGPLGPLGTDCLHRARRRVINIMLITALGIAVSGVILRASPTGAFPFPRERTRQLAQLLLFTLALASIWLRVRLHVHEGEPMTTRADRFVSFRTASSVAAALGVPLGLAYSWAIEPDLAAVAPFWAVALGFNVLAIPRSSQVESLGLDGSNA